MEKKLTKAQKEVIRRMREGVGYLWLEQSHQTRRSLIKKGILYRSEEKVQVPFGGTANVIDFYLTTLGKTIEL